MTFCVNLTAATVHFLYVATMVCDSRVSWTVVKGRYHSAYKYTGPVVRNAASVTFCKDMLLSGLD